MEENLGKTSPIGVSGEFDHTAMIHVVMPVWEYDEMYNAKQQNNVEGISRNQLWEVINENTQLKQENYMLKHKLKQIEKLVTNYDIYE